MKRVKKLIGAFVTRAYKNAHLSIGMDGVQMRDGLDGMKRYSEKQVMNLGQLMRGNSRISTPMNGSISEI